MSPMVSIRPAPTAARSISQWVVRGKQLPRPSGPSIRSLYTARSIATNAAVQEPSVEFPGPLGGLQPASQQSLEQRKEAIKSAKPFSAFLTDSFNRQHDYLRISITERCNLRCLYCMPEEGVPLSPPAHLLTTPEIVYLSSLFVSQGVTKIRLTGGEPTVRRDVLPLMHQIGALRSKGLKELAITTNGISLHRKLDSMVEAGLTGVNLSLDTLDPYQFQIMTRRKGFDAVMKCIERILEMNKRGAGVKLKVNCVVMRGLNERDIIPFVELGREKDIEVRFIEYMPFGGNKWSEGKMISFQEMLDIIRAKYPGLRSVKGYKNDTSKTFEVPGFVGRVGFITSMTSDFCGTCNRLRITGDGNLKVCLHGNDEVSLRDLLRQGNNGEPIDQEAFERIRKIEMDHHEGFSDRTTLGWGERERELLEVIGVAVKKKAEKHADMGDLKNMTNRPMILIDSSTRPTPIHATTHNPDDASHITPHLTRYSPSSELRTWSSIPLPRLPFLYPSLAPSLASHARTFHSKPRGPFKSSVNSIKKADVRSRARDAEVRTQEMNMLRALRAAEVLHQKTEPNKTPEDMHPKTYEKLLRKVEKGGKAASIAQQKLIRMAKRADLEKALKEDGLAVTDLDVKEDEGKTKGDDVGKLMGEIMSSVPVTEQRLVRLPGLIDLQKKIRYLEARIEMETLGSPLEDPGKWQDYHALPQGKVVGRETKRAMWRKRRKAAARIANLESEGGVRPEERAKLEQQHQEEVEEMRRMLGQFSIFLEKYQGGGLPVSGRRDWNAMVQRDAAKWTSESNADKKEMVLKEREEKLDRLGKLGHRDYTRDMSKDRFGAVERDRGRDTEVGIEGEDIRRPRRIDRDTLKSFKVPELSFRPKIETKITAMEVDAQPEPGSDTLVKGEEEKKPDSRLGQLRDIVSSMSYLKELTGKTTSDEADDRVKIELKSPVRYLDGSDIFVSQQNLDSRTMEASQPVSQQGRVSYDDSFFALHTPTPRRTDPQPSPSEPTIFGTSHPPEPIPPSWPEPQKKRSLSENLKPSFPAEGKLVIDEELTINFDSHISDMQSQLFQLQNRLKNAYPRIDTLPYEVWTSKNRLVLKTWLKILTGKWVSRFDDVSVTRNRFSGGWEEGVLAEDVKGLLDTMVRDHDLTNEAAERMGKRWMQVFDRRGGIEGDSEGKLDLEEFDAQMGWLRDNNTREEEGRLGGGFLGGMGEREEKEEEGRDHGKEVGSMFEELPYTWSSKPSDGFRRVGSRGVRSFSTSTRCPTSNSKNEEKEKAENRTTSTPPSSTAKELPHLTSTGSAHMVSVSSKPYTTRTAIAVGTVTFSNPIPLTLIRSNSLKKGDVLSVSRIAGIMAAKRTPDIIPLCHPITLTHAGVELFLFSPSEGKFKEREGKGNGGVKIEAKVECTGATGVEMEALTAVSAAALTVVDMCKAVDKGMRIQDVRVVLKEGGRSGVWREEGWVSAQK